jgi:predicted aspartyl protease
MKFKIKPGEPILVFMRVKGKNGVRELRAIIDTGSQYSVISFQDARRLGYEAYFDIVSDPGGGTRTLTQAGIIEVDEISLEEVSIGELVAKDVKTLAFDLPKFGRTEAILGLSFLKNFKTTIDFKQGFLTLEPA